MDIVSGGVRVKAGGLTVEGGLSVMTGGLHLKNQLFSAGQLLISQESSSCNPAGTGGSGSGSGGSNTESNILKIEALSSTYTGNLIQLYSQSDNSASYSFLQAKYRDNVLLDIDGDGMLKSNSGAIFKGKKGLTVFDQSNLLGGLSINKITVSAGNTIDLSKLASSFMVISNDHNKLKNDVILKKKESGAVEG